MENSTVDQSLIKKVKKFCDEWHRGNIYGNRQSFKLAQKYLDQLKDWINDHWGQETEEGKLVDYIHNQLVGVVEWCSFNGTEKQSGSMFHKDKI